MSRSRWPVCPVLVGLALVATWGPAGLSAENPGGSKLRGDLAAMIEKAAPDQLVPVSIVLADQVPEPAIARLAGEEGAGRKIAMRLRSLAQGTQAGLLGELRAAEGHGRAARIRPLWLSNLVGADATPEVIRALALRPEVAWINHNPRRPVFLGTSGEAVDAGKAAYDWGVLKMRAPQVWSELDIKGRGVVVADIDSGSCYEHPDIIGQIWINPGEDLDHDGAVMDSSDVNHQDDDGNGFVDDFIGWNFEDNTNDPNDFNGHGSHTTGTVAGDGTEGTISGVAPEARMMIVKVGLSLADEVDVWNGMQYAAENGADLITMSLGWQHSWDPDRATWRRNCDNTLAMGTIMIVAAGNEGGGNEPDNVRTPGDVPSVITIGATDTADAAAYFTSEGPVTWSGVSPYNDFPYPPGLIKPDLSAPGVDTVSLNFCDGYSTMSGTSMATPHAAGAAALMLEGDPFLSRNELLQIMAETAIELGEPGKDNVFGFGRIDAYAAVFEANAKLRYAGHRVDDTGTDRGNGDLALDPGETVQIVVTLRNTDEADTFTGIVAYLSSETPGFTVLDNRAAYPDLGPGQIAEQTGPAFTIKADTACFTDAQLRLDIYNANGRRSRSRFTARVGSPVPTVLFADDGEADRGWTVSGTAADGLWERGVPKGTTSLGRQANPGQDASPTGTRAWVTGNQGVSAKDDDVDQGETILTSPRLSAAQYAALDFSYSRWFYREGLPTLPPDRWFIVEASNDDGANWAEVETLLPAAGSWTAMAFSLDERLTLTDNLRVRVRVNDTAGTDQVTEGGLDEVVIQGDRIVCDTWVPPALQLPPPVGDSLRLSLAGSDLKLSWNTPVPGPGQGPATRYAVLGGENPALPLAPAGGATRPEWWQQNARGDGRTLGLYLVRSENSAGQEP